jgi:hypothetical protein
MKRSQPAIYDDHGHRISREPALALVPPEMKDWVRTQMRLYNMSGSWVIAVALSYASGIEIEKPKELKTRRKPRKVKP